MQYSQELLFMQNFGGQSECIMGDSKIENFPSSYSWNEVKQSEDQCIKRLNSRWNFKISVGARVRFASPFST